ncbi:hypothetical protein D3C80_1975780 [compost metagenome]
MADNVVEVGDPRVMRGLVGVSMPNSFDQTKKGTLFVLSQLGSKFHYTFLIRQLAA